jgi:hypothetical protein
MFDSVTSRVALLSGAMLCPLWAQSQPRNLELFLLIGQSNMVGRGVVEEIDRQPIPRVWAQDKDLKWQPATDPLHWDNTQAGVGPGRPFARWLAQVNPKVEIGLIPAASGGTSLQQWAPGGQLYTEALRRLRAALLSGKLRGILWHQGERDSRDDSAFTYIGRLGEFVEQLRRDVGASDIPIVVGEIGEFLYTRNDTNYLNALLINQQLALVPVSIYRTAFVSSAGLGHIGDELHFNAASQREFGRRYALAFLSLDPAWWPPAP